MNSELASRIRVLLLIPHLGTGGAQHVIATLACHLDLEKCEVHLVLLTQSTGAVPEFPEATHVYCLGAKRARYSAPRLVALARRLRPHLVFAGMAHLAPLVLLLRFFLPTRTRFILRQNGSLPGCGQQRSLCRTITSAGYKRADAVICQTQATAEEVRRRFQINPTRIHVLPNPVDIQRIRDISCPSRITDPYLLAVGRLVPEKGFDLLLDAFAALEGDFPTLRLFVAGTGRCRAALEFQSRLLGLSHRVVFLGDVSDPPRYFGDARAFTLSSREDELPNALLEAAAAGLPIIATPASAGLSTLLTGQPGIWLAEGASTISLEAVLRTALNSIAPNQRFAHHWIERFGLSPAVAAYEQLFEEVVCGVSN